MYADRHAGSSGIKPVSLGASLLVNGAVLLALAYAAPNVIGHKDSPFEATFMPVPPPPPPQPPKAQPRSAHSTQAPLPDAPTPKVALPTTPTFNLPLTPPLDPGPIAGLGDGPAVTPSPLPALIGAAVDSRYAGDFQPTYPPAERRAGHEGRVVVRVLIGVDGRVKQVERVSAASDAFFAATRERALSKWRFEPATRGDVPVEQWKQMSVSFVLEDE